MPASSSGLPSALLEAALRRAPAAPLLTFYDDAADERTELSATTFGNWVAKTANLLQDELDVGPGSRIAVTLPVHWQTAAALLGAWSCGAAVVDMAAEDDVDQQAVDLVLAPQDRLAALEDALAPEAEGGPPLLGFSLHPLGLGMRGYTGAARDFALDVRAAGDHFTPYQPVDADAPGLVAGSVQLSMGGLVRAASELAARLQLRAGDRLLVDDVTAAEAGPVAWLLAPLLAEVSIVLCRHPRDDRLARRAEAEQVTVTVGVEVPGIRRAGQGGASPP